LETGAVTLIGATPEDPRFSLNAALLSRCRVVALEPHSPGAVVRMLERALADAEYGLGARQINLAPEVLTTLSERCDGDARRALNWLEAVARWIETTAAEREDSDHPSDGPHIIDDKILGEIVTGGALRHDRTGDDHYDLVSAFIKSLRGSSPDGALYYAARMVASGEDPRFIFRRLIIFASEDIGNADPRALQVTLDAAQGFDRIGMPEGRLLLAQAVTFCASAPKSNASYVAWNEAAADIEASGSLPIPRHLRNAPTALMKSMGNAKDYKYPHDFDGHFVREKYLPDALSKRRYYRRCQEGYERHISERLKRWWGED
ncbi:MAG: replication-associated recombination protein A, partial [Myxococcales bacterium]|nr:replication-associated recombination protein A [Myxococcales bacterium]